VLCAGAWSGQLLDAILPPPSPASGAMAYRDIITPLRGHLLQIPASEGVPQLRHGVMECKYTKVGFCRCYVDFFVHTCHPSGYFTRQHNPVSEGANLLKCMSK
jgi:hypothetical protein